jgi:PAS domain S-box-containing protein
MVGSGNADIAGSTWGEIAELLHIDQDGKVQAALDGRGQWSGLKIYWPVEGSDLLIAAELSAFPVFERGLFSGHRGVGILRPEDNRREGPKPPDLTAATPPLEGNREAPYPTNEPTQPDLPPKASESGISSDQENDLDDAARESIEQAPRLVSEGDFAPSPSRKRRKTDRQPRAIERSNVVVLPGTQATHSPAQERLSGSERDAFRRIAETLAADKKKEKGSRTREALAGKGGEPNPAAAEKSPSELDTKILDRLPIGIVVFRGDRTLFANRTLLDLLGYDDVADFEASGGGEALFPDGEPSWAVPETEKVEGLLSARRKDGSQLPVEARLQSVTWADATALLLSVRERSQKEYDDLSDDILKEVASVEARLGELEAILDTATDGVIVIDGRGRISNFNRSAEALFGVEASDVLGKPFTDLLADESRKAALDYLDGLAENGVASVLNDGREVIGKVPQGGLIPLFMTMGRLGRTDKFCAVLRDITHWKNAEEELVAARRAAETANAQKSDFLAKISHEIRTPLNAIIGFSELMAEERFGPIGNQRYRDYLRDIHVSGSHLMSLINDLLDLSKIEAGKLELSFESVAINEAIQECVALMQQQANRERIIIRTSLSSGVPNIVADPRSLRQILLNLLSNAIKFTQAGGQVIVSTAIEDNGEVVIRIRDTGVGMSEKDIETALKPFRQLATSGRPRGEGTGLGLPLTKALVEANRAAFAIDSAVNQGTLVKITFPTTRVLAG